MSIQQSCVIVPLLSAKANGREPLLEAIRQKLRTEEEKQIYKKRGYTVEPVFGEMKWDGRKLVMNLRGSMKVRGEFSLMCLLTMRVGDTMIQQTNILEKLNYYKHIEN